ncbi:MAG: hypothetical protein H6711_19900 [Myxococcales bacterium]|nr:hypothetical protein [Myxococcales bacterium]
MAAPEGDAAEADAAPPSEAARPCRHGERLESGCACPEGACFDICCGPNADCAHPATPGGPSACMLRPLAPPPEAAPAVDEAPRDPPAARPCTDGESLSSGCACERRCIDICCVGSACSHRSGPDGGWAKCVRIPQTR